MPERVECRIRGMDYTDEVAILRREIGPLVGESSRLSFDILRGKMIVDRGVCRAHLRRLLQPLGCHRG